MCLNYLEEECFKLAEEALSFGEVPVGAIIINDCGRIIAKGRNTVNQTKNACSHAEINCINQVIDECKNEQISYEDLFKKCDLLVTIEPCIMCAKLLRELKFKQIVYGAKNDRFGGCGTVLSVHNDININQPELICVDGGLDKERAINLIKKFYEGENPNAPQPKPKKVKVTQNNNQNNT